MAILREMQGELNLSNDEAQLALVLMARMKGVTEKKAGEWVPMSERSRYRQFNRGGCARLFVAVGRNPAPPGMKALTEYQQNLFRAPKDRP